MSPGTTKQARDARNTLWTEIWAGRFERKGICERCGGTRNIDAHHDDYAKPLDVRWFCKSCHRRHHLELEGKQPGPMREEKLPNFDPLIIEVALADGVPTGTIAKWARRDRKVPHKYRSFVLFAALERGIPVPSFEPRSPA